MRTLTVFNYEDFVKVCRLLGAEKIVGIYVRTAKVTECTFKASVMASTSIKDAIIELDYFAIYEADVFIDRAKKQLEPKAQELVEKLKNEGFEVVDGYWHGGRDYA